MLSTASLDRDCCTTCILEVVDRGDVAVLALLDLSAAFGTVDHDILFRRLQKTDGINGKALRWFQTYLGGRKKYVRRARSFYSVQVNLQFFIVAEVIKITARSTSCSDPVAVMCGVPQGSVLGP